MPAFDTSPAGMLRALVAHRRLIWQLARRDVQGRYRGSILGLAWSLVTPLLLLAVYTFVFAVVFGARWAGPGQVPAGGHAGFAVIAFAGLVLFNLFAEGFNRAPGLILGNVNFVKRVVFPLEVLPVVALLAALFHVCVALLAWAALAIFVLHGLPATALLLPLVLAPLLLGTLGLMWVLASLGVYARDIGQVTGIVATVLLFLSPIFYPLAAVPEPYRTLMAVNPLSVLVEAARAVLIFGNAPDWIALAWCWIGGFALACAGWWWFQKTRAGFADVL
ncbi:MAG: ABC transporter permease [Proteobacteria bacterium]|nr:ABC transporter permease [Pseudomonadota bacterium]MBS0462606.1 ABC transporter permease [Pseudomonadota bacterium]MBS0464389.1 ABC transporter permease [Pseudomonadota bacterium]